jgi:hypothetical protein
MVRRRQPVVVERFESPEHGPFVSSPRGSGHRRCDWLVGGQKGAPAPLVERSRGRTLREPTAGRAGPSEGDALQAPWARRRTSEPRPSKASLGLSITKWGAAPNRGERSRPQRRTAWRATGRRIPGRVQCVRPPGDPPGAVCAAGRRLSTLTARPRPRSGGKTKPPQHRTPVTAGGEITRGVRPVSVRLVGGARRSPLGVVEGTREVSGGSSKG